jgi:epoxyqueuosine reductase
MNGLWDYPSLASQIGAEKLACLAPSDCQETLLRQYLTHWMEVGNAGALPYIDTRAHILSSPFSSRPWARSLLIAAFLPPPLPADFPLRQLPPAEPNRPRTIIASYALQEDYHITGKRLLNTLQELIAGVSATPPQFEACVDTHPVMEKPLAALANLGRIAPNSLLRTPEHGCRSHLALLFTSAILPPWKPPCHFDISCEDCRRCLGICPNHAFTPTDFHVRRCRSWLANEKRGPLSWEEQQLLQGALYSCSICSTSCPSTCSMPTDYAVDALKLFEMPTRKLEQLIAGTALEHSGPILLKRNALAALGWQWSPQQRQEQRHRLASLTHSPALLQTLENWP